MTARRPASDEVGFLLFSAHRLHAKKCGMRLDVSRLSLFKDTPIAFRRCSDYEDRPDFILRLHRKDAEAYTGKTAGRIGIPRKILI